MFVFIVIIYRTLTKIHCYTLRWHICILYRLVINSTFCTNKCENNIIKIFK